MSLPIFHTQPLPRAIRYIIVVNGEMVETNGRLERAFRRAYAIARDAKGWPNAVNVSVVDSWHRIPTTVIKGA